MTLRPPFDRITIEPETMAGNEEEDLKQALAFAAAAVDGTFEIYIDAACDGHSIRTSLGFWP